MVSIFENLEKKVLKLMYKFIILFVFYIIVSEINITNAPGIFILICTIL